MNNPWFQLVASLISMIMIANLQYAWTLFVGPIQGANHWKLSDVQLAFTLFINFQTFVQPADGWFIDKIGPRKFITVAGILCGVGWSALAYATTLPRLYFFYAVAGIGAAFVYSGAIGGALKWFPNRRGLASGVIAAGFGGGTALFIPVIQHLINTQTYRSAFLYTGIFQGLIIAIVAQFLRHPGPDYIAAKSAAPTVVKVKARRNSEQFTTGEMLRTPHFYFMYLMFVAAATGGLVVTAQAGPLVKSWGLAAVALTAATSLSPVANGASRIFWGWVSDHIGREVTMSVAFAIQCACLFGVLTLGKTSATMFTVMLVLTFFTWGEVYSLFPSTTGDYFGSRNATSNYALLYTAKGVATILAAYVGSRLFERLGSWDAVFYGCAILALLSAAGALVLKAAPLPKKKTVLNDAVMANVAR